MGLAQIKTFHHPRKFYDLAHGKHSGCAVTFHLMHVCKVLACAMPHGVNLDSVVEHLVLIALLYTHSKVSRKFFPDHASHIH